MSTTEVPKSLDMGVWVHDGEIVWMPKAFRPTRNDAKRFAQAEMEIYDWIDIRVSTCWIKEKRGTGGFHFEAWYVLAEKGEPGAIECWRITSA